MIRAAIALVCFVAFAYTQLQEAAGGEPLHVLRLTTQNPKLLFSTLEKLNFDVLHPYKNYVDVIASEKELKQFLSMPKQLFTDVKLVDTRVQSPDLLDVSSDIVQLVDGGVLPKGVPAGYHSPKQIVQFLNDLAKNNSDIAQVIDLTKQYGTGPTVDGNSVLAIKIAANVSQVQDKENILIASCHHAREIITPEIALYTADTIISKYRAKDQLYLNILARSQIWIIAVVNVDGLIYVHEKNNWWRKNRKLVDTQQRIYGVDLNRNYDLGWGKCGGSTQKDSETYKGPSELSEVESQTIVALSKDYSFAKVLDFHSYGRQVLTAYTCTKMPRTASDYITKRGMELMGFAKYDHRVPTNDGEHQEHQIKHHTSYTFLVETGEDFQPPFSESVAEIKRVYPLIEHFLNVSIPVKGHVRDQDGKPVVAQIQVDKIQWVSGETRHSEGRFGAYHLFLPADQQYAVTFSADNFVEQTVNIHTSADGVYGSVTQDIVLKRK